jgi:hypothetical protein
MSVRHANGRNLREKSGGRYHIYPAGMPDRHKSANCARAEYKIEVTFNEYEAHSH